MQPLQSPNYGLSPRVVAWETTVACPLACIHCRADAQPKGDPDELTTSEGFALLADIASMGGPTVVILTGGEPLTRPDIFDLAEFGAKHGLQMAVSPDDGRLLTPDTASRLKAAGIQRVSFSLHYPDPEENDRFARTPGAYAAAMQGLANLRVAGLPFQINTTVTRLNAGRLRQMYEIVRSLEPVCWDLFFLVPTGRARPLQGIEMPPEQYERELNWLYDLQSESSIVVKQTCAPHYRRIERQRGKAGDPERSRPQTEPPSRSHSRQAGAAASGQPGAKPSTVLSPPSPGAPGLFADSAYSHRHSASSRGCMCGNGFAFVSRSGQVQGCGYLNLPAGNVRDRPFSEIYRTSPLFAALRDVGQLGGKCGICEYRQICGGCRARAYAASGDYLGEEPYCVYEPAHS